MSESKSKASLANEARALGCPKAFNTLRKLPLEALDGLVAHLREEKAINAMPDTDPDINIESYPGAPVGISLPTEWIDPPDDDDDDDLPDTETVPTDRELKAQICALPARKAPADRHHDAVLVAVVLAGVVVLAVGGLIGGLIGL